MQVTSLEGGLHCKNAAFFSENTRKNISVQSFPMWDSTKIPTKLFTRLDFIHPNIVGSLIYPSKCSSLMLGTPLHTCRFSITKSSHFSTSCLSSSGLGKYNGRLTKSLKSLPIIPCTPYQTHSCINS